MPTIGLIDGIKINIYFNDHAPPHVHAIYAEHEVLLTIDTADVYGGSLPNRQLRKAQYYILDATNNKRIKSLWKQYNGA